MFSCSLSRNSVVYAPERLIMSPTRTLLMLFSHKLRLIWPVSSSNVASATDRTPNLVLTWRGCDMSTIFAWRAMLLIPLFISLIFTSLTPCLSFSHLIFILFKLYTGQLLPSSTKNTGRLDCHSHDFV